MKKKIIFFIIIQVSFLFAFDKRIKIETADKKLYNQIKQQKIENELYNTEDKIKLYVAFLLNEKVLPIPNLNYSFTIFDEKEDWMILLNIKDEMCIEDNIIDNLDGISDYALIISKKNGEIKSFVNL